VALEKWEHKPQFFYSKASAFGIGQRSIEPAKYFGIGDRNIIIINLFYHSFSYREGKTLL
jgi:hypothetical protein